MNPTPQETLERIERALQREPSDARLLLQQAHCLLVLGRRAAAFAAAAAAERAAPRDPAVRDAAGTLYSYGNDHRRALASYDAALALAPRSPQLLYNRASVRRFVGDLAGAEQDYDQVVALRPTDYEAYKNRTDLRTQTAERNHVAELEALAAAPIADWRGVVQIGFALAKEYEDLGRYSLSFERLRQAAAKRRAHMNYDVANDVSTVQWIIEAFPASAPSANAAPATVAQEPAAADGDAGPIFVLGLPRSGTTLVERILSSHSTVTSAGELDCFAQALVQSVAIATGQPKLPRRELVANSARVDFQALGRDYLRRAHQTVGVSGRFVDKMPLNYLYCGLIHRALPRARMVHLTRHPMAVCYAMYKTLFKDGYPFSYDLLDIAQYYIAYRRLMAHWQDTLPGEIHHVSYEALVADQIGESRKLLDFCGLPWEEACANFKDNPSASTTASAAQVRRPIYDSSVSQWRHYEAELQPLRMRLEAAGIDIP